MFVKEYTMAYFLALIIHELGDAGKASPPNRLLIGLEEAVEFLSRDPLRET